MVELYHAALALPASERQAFLEEGCGGDAELLLEVSSLLAHAEDAKRLLQQPVAEAATEKLAVLPGTRLGPYEVTDLLGAGGMGEVYRARDTTLDREVAIKVLSPVMAERPEPMART